MRIPSLMLLAALSLLASGAHAETFTESWYLLRGRANMQIGNHKAAIEAFAKACELDPGNREAMRTLGVAYGLEGLTDQAVAQFDKYLARFPDDPEIAFKQADYLSWSRYDYRRKDAIAYLKLGLGQKNDPKERRQLAKLLGRDKSTLEDALTEYRTLLEGFPRDGGLRADYRKLLAWDKRHHPEAITEYQAYVGEHPHDTTATHELAKLLAEARDPAAAPFYANLVAARPGDAALRLEYARELAGLSGRDADAAAQYAAALQARPDVAVRAEYADTLARRAETRSAALAEYRIVLKARPQDQAVRLRYARLLLAEEGDAAEAARQYEQVLAKDPGNQEAHRGAAKAYAWTGDKDKALYHSRQVREAPSGDAAGEMVALTHELMRGREPRVGTRIHALDQPGEEFRLQGGEVGAFARRDLGPFATGGVEAGYERYADTQEARDGVYGLANLEYRFNEHAALAAAGGYHGLVRMDPTTYRVAATISGDGWKLTPGYREDLRYDSLLALAGKTEGGETLGAAREAVAFLEGTVTVGAWRYDFAPEIGAVSTADGASNDLQEIDARAETDLWQSDAWSLAGAGLAQVAHYAEDRSGFAASDDEPRAGGYYSPRAFLAATPELALRYQVPAALASAELRAGPSLQYSRTVADGAKLVLGVDAEAYGGWRLGGYDLDFTASYLRLPDIGARLEGSLALAKLF